jgi:hypothetical protein
MSIDGTSSRVNDDAARRIYKHQSPRFARSRRLSVVHNRIAGP